jgi:hypothetical protein
MTDVLTPIAACRQIAAALADAVPENASPAVTEHLRSMRDSDAIGRLLLIAALRDGRWMATGYSTPDGDAVQIQPRCWHFLTLDTKMERASASSPHKLAYVGLRVARVPEPITGAHTVADERKAAAWLKGEIEAGRITSITGKDNTLALVKAEFCLLSGKALERVWCRATEQAGRADFSRSGRKRRAKSPREITPEIATPI